MKCPVCGSNNTYYRFTIKRFTPNFKIRGCPECLSNFQYPIAGNPNAHYSEEYYSGMGEYQYHDEREQYAAKKIVYDARLKQIKKYRASGNFLDVGCSFGGFVQAASTEHYNAYGIDVSKHAIEAGLEWVKRDLNSNTENLKVGEIADLEKAFPDVSFDIVTIIEVIEHIVEPRTALSQLSQRMNSGGVLVLQTANFEGWQAIKGQSEYNYFLPGHYTYFTAGGLKNLLRDCGFSRHIEFIPVDFGVLPKLRKSAKSFNSIFDYFRWFRIVYYHFKSYFKKMGRPLTSSYVIYAIKD